MKSVWYNQEKKHYYKAVIQQDLFFKWNLIEDWWGEEKPGGIKISVTENFNEAMDKLIQLNTKLLTKKKYSIVKKELTVI